MNQFKWQWLKIETGQALPINHRAELVRARERPALSPRGPIRDRELDEDHRSGKPRRSAQEREGAQPAGGENPRTGQERPSRRSRGLDLQRALSYVAARRDDDRVVGNALRRVANEGTPGEIAGFKAGFVELIRQGGDASRSQLLVACTVVPARSLLAHRLRDTRQHVSYRLVESRIGQSVCQAPYEIPRRWKARSEMDAFPPTRTLEQEQTRQQP